VASKPLIAPRSTAAEPPAASDSGNVRRTPCPLSTFSTTRAGLVLSGLASHSLVAKNVPVAPSAR
jgi:hypothetical protein